MGKETENATQSPAVGRWWSRPTNEVPAVVPLQAVLARTDHIVISLNGARVYSQGVELCVHVHVQAPSPVTAMSALSVCGPSMRDRCLFGVEFPDGSASTNIDNQATRRTATAPVLTSGSGGGGPAHSTFTFQLAPIPPAGQMAIWVAWPAAGVPESRVEIDTEPLRQAVDRVQVLWPEQTGSVWTPTPSERPELPAGGWFAKVTG
ncbi:MAG: hypothetical protein JWN03_5702 [Nocardia sp.]|uniref:hypothetical protein n=1 Tax=Nocardia sp. TaxID=1821 RepID=UPI002636EEA2|nr:hypothetical protein [Nocardia sp.]MCU1645427.1 hypothetical protein [Nocardia sp.]